MDLREYLTNGIPRQTQDQQPGSEKEMNPAPIFEDESYQGSGKLKGKVALITGGDSGIDGQYLLPMQRKVHMLPLCI